MALLTVTSGNLGALSVITSKIDDLAVTTAKIADGAVTPTKLGYASVAISASAIDWSLGEMFTKTMTGNTTFTFSNLVEGKRIKVFLTGAFTPAFPATVKWAGNLGMPARTGSYNLYTFDNFGGTVLGRGEVNFDT